VFATGPVLFKCYVELQGDEGDVDFCGLVVRSVRAVSRHTNYLSQWIMPKKLALVLRRERWFSKISKIPRSLQNMERMSYPQVPAQALAIACSGDFIVYVKIAGCVNAMGW